MAVLAEAAPDGPQTPRVLLERGECFASVGACLRQCHGDRGECHPVCSGLVCGREGPDAAQQERLARPGGGPDEAAAAAFARLRAHEEL